jgi:hypothetical protein
MRQSRRRPSVPADRSPRSGTPRRPSRTPFQPNDSSRAPP